MEKIFYRNIIKELAAWKESSDRKPLILLGARQVGKTYILKHFGKKYYKNTVYINCDKNEKVKDLFAEDYNIERIILNIAAVANDKIIPNETLIILDEIQELKRGLSSLKYFCEDAPEYHICTAGSLLGIAMRHGESFPVGKVDMMKMFPMTFDEFLRAKGYDTMADILLKKDWNVIKGLHDTLNQILREYYFVGGMPSAVSKFINSNNANAVRNVQRNILSAYSQDMSKHTKAPEIKRINQVWNSLPAQLSKENKKFIFGAVRKGGRAKDFEVAIQWLIDAGLVHRIARVTKPAMMLKFYEDFSAFKLYLLDVGLLGALADTPPDVLLMPNNMKESKGMFAENFVCTQLAASVEHSLFYYSRDTSNSKLEIDFVIQQGNKIVPIEIKAEENLQSKSLKTVLQNNPEMHGVRFSMSPYKEQERMTNVPLYGAGVYFSKY
ncbi:MAG: ATP-binding protein [Bacteroidetes bacterium]|nr:ATP-binding protein [Bacteroidota bacterium]